jgi:opacity protein-like surface antigen
MKHLLCASAIALVALVTAAAAVAVPPSAGATYRGNSSGQRARLPLPVTLKVADDGKSLTFTIRCRTLGRRFTFSLKGVKVNAQGGFSKSGKSQGVPLKVSGKFVSATKASGKFDTGACFAGDASFTARR